MPVANFLPVWKENNWWKDLSFYHFESLWIIFETPRSQVSQSKWIRTLLKIAKSPKFVKVKNRISNNPKFKTVNAKKVFKRVCWNANVKTRWNHWKVSRKPQEKAKEALEHALNWLMSLWKKNANRSSSGRPMTSCFWDKTSARTTSPSTQDDRQEIVAWQRKSELFMFYKDC